MAGPSKLFNYLILVDNETLTVHHRYFGDDTVVEQTLASIRGYTPSVAHWMWNGNARRYW
jgi:hypothetical protein